MRFGRHFTLTVFCAVFVLTLAACKSNKFVGTWKPEENQRNLVAKSLEIKNDGTWHLTTVYDKQFTGTHKIVGDTLQMTDDNAVRYSTVATIESDGRLKLIEGEKPPVYFHRG
jgi:hypothetical protein